MDWNPACTIVLREAQTFVRGGFSVQSMKSNYKSSRIRTDRRDRSCRLICVATPLRALLIVVFSLGLTVPLTAQSPTRPLAISAVVGTVTDVSGNVVEGATVILRSTVSSKEEDTVVTTDNGFFEFPNLEPGTYEVSIHAKGFADWTSSPIPLQANEYRVLAHCSIRVDLGRKTAGVYDLPQDSEAEHVAPTP